MAGAASHLDLFDYKPELVKHHGQPSDFGEQVEAFQNGLGPVAEAASGTSSPTASAARCSSEVVAPLGAVRGRDRVRPQHGRQDGRAQPGDATAGHRLSTARLSRHGLLGQLRPGQLNDNLPTFVVLPDHRGFASNGTKNWDSAFLPAQHQGTIIYPGTRQPDRRPVPAPKADFITPDSEAAAHRHCWPSSTASTPPTATATRGSKPASAATNWPPRCSSPRPRRSTSRDEPAAHPEALRPRPRPADVSDKEINPVEETDYFGRKCLVARRLLERGVRFVQIWTGNDNGFPRRNWDSHEDIQRDHGPLATGMARGAAALIQDLKQRGLLDDTIILWTTEFGRMPSIAGRQGPRPQPVLLHQLALRRRHQGRRHATARATSGATSRRTATTPRRSTTSTPRSCTCSASTTRSSPSATTASTAA